MISAFCRQCSWSVVLIGIAGSASTARSADANQLIDLTHTFDETTVYWPTEDGFKLLRGPAGVTERGYFYVANRFMCAEHGGTHIDAPIHFWKGGQTVDQILLKRLIGPAACVDVSRKCRGDRDYQVSVEDFSAWENANQTTLNDKIVLIRTGYTAHWPDREKYLGTSETGRAAVAKLHFPGLDSAAADWLVTRRKIRAVGIDTASIDYGQTQDYATHQRLFRAGVPALENVALPNNLPANNFQVIALPMKIGGGSGAPCRVVAILAD